MDYWHELGLCGSSGFGATVLTFSEIESWQRTTGVSLTPWETLAIRQFSRVYVNTLSAATRKTMPSPSNDNIEKRRESVDAAWRELARQHRKAAEHDGHRTAKR